MKPELKIKLIHEAAKCPAVAHNTDAGYDVYTPEAVYCPAGLDTFIPVGWKCEFNAGFAMIFKEKSGVSKNKKLSVCSGVIDAAYRGEVVVHFRNTSGTDVSFDPGEKIAQFMMIRVFNDPAIVVEELSDTERGEGGFGSTGVF